MTKQEYFDLLVKTSREGGFPARNVHGSCVYRTEDGKKCAVGLLIPDTRYKVMMEGSAAALFAVHTELRDIIPKEMSVVDLQQVQNVHDNNPYMEGWDHEKFVEGLTGLDCFAGL